jgi:hypothetical protein
MAKDVRKSGGKNMPKMTREEIRARTVATLHARKDLLQAIEDVVRNHRLTMHELNMIVSALMNDWSKNEVSAYRRGERS